MICHIVIFKQGKSIQVVIQDTLFDCFIRYIDIGNFHFIPCPFAGIFGLCFLVIAHQQFQQIIGQGSLSGIRKRLDQMFIRIGKIF